MQNNWNYATNNKIEIYIWVYTSAIYYGAILQNSSLALSASAMRSSFLSDGIVNRDNGFKSTINARFFEVWSS